MSRWFRFYDDAVNDPRVQRLPGEKFKAWVNLLCLASRNDGALPCIADIAFGLRLSEDAVSGLLDEFCALGLMDPIEVPDAPMSYEPHNWKGRQFKSDNSTSRVQRFRNGQCNVSETVAPSNDETPPETEAESETETNKQIVRLPARDDDWPFNYRELFWASYPHKVGKTDALAKLDRVRRRGVSWRKIFTALAAYVQTKPPDRPWCNPATWINQGRWDDEPQNFSPQRRVVDV